MNPGFKKKKGHSYCPRCEAEYNNKVKPKYCTQENCGGYLGGSYKPPQKDYSLPDAKLITRDIASVRLHKTGHPIRVFVDLKQNKVCVKTKAIHILFI